MSFTSTSRRSAFIACAFVGLVLIAAPFALGMFNRAPQGATMLSAFKPFMTEQRLDGFQNDIATINAAVHETNTTARTRLTADKDTAISAGPYADFAQQWPQINATMSDLLTKVHANLGNYQAVAALPSFSLFPWFFLIPGALLVGGAGLALWRPAVAGRVRVGLAVLGIGLVAAPLAFGMFSRAPKGGHMMDAFTTIETTQNVSRIQGYFGTMAGGQGALRLDVVPALERSGLTSAQVASDFPAIAALDANWIHILNDMTPMIGAMSDSVPHYQALTALPPFPLFPWFFVIPGVLVTALVLIPSRDRPAAPVSSTPELQGAPA